MNGNSKCCHNQNFTTINSKTNILLYKSKNVKRLFGKMQDKQLDNYSFYKYEKICSNRSTKYFDGYI